MYVAYFTIPHSDADGRWARWARWYSAPGARAILLRPDNQGTTHALLSFRTTQRGHEDLDVEAQKQRLRQVYAGAGYEAPRVLADMDSADDFYFEAVGQVKLPRWSKGRVRPYVDKAQKVFPGMLNFASPRSRVGIALARAVLGFAASPMVSGVLAKLTATKTADKISLPAYPMQ